MKDWDELMKKLDIRVLSDEELTKLCEVVIHNNPKAVQDLRDGKKKAIGKLIGEVRKRDKNADPVETMNKLEELL